jgi:hypothetical protein
LAEESDNELNFLSKDNMSLKRIQILFHERWLKPFVERGSYKMEIFGAKDMQINGEQDY